MDRKRRAEIIRFVTLFLLTVFCIAAGGWIYVRQEENLRWEQIAELSGLHPELEADLVRILDKGGGEDRAKADTTDQKDEEKIQIRKRLEETYGYGIAGEVFRRQIGGLYGYSLFVAAVLFFLFYGISAGKKKRAERYVWDLRKSGEILREFSQGNYQVPEAVFEKRREEEEKEGIKKTGGQIEMELEELFREHGNYLTMLKERYEKEEIRTKALITDISHQLKTPLSSLRMSHELVESAYLTEEERREFLRQERVEIEKLQKLLDKMMKLSRLEKNMIHLKPEPAGLQDTISEAVSVVYPKAAGKSMEIQVEIKEDIVLEHDPHWTAEAFVNILDNAVKYAPEHTRILIRAEKLIRYAMVAFQDEGPGIPEEERHRIYQRFYRGTQSEGVEGVGIGLYLARKILEEEHGSIRVKSGYPVGSVFYVMLPL